MVGLLLLLSSLMALPLLGDFFASDQVNSDDQDDQDDLAAKDNGQGAEAKARVEIRGGDGSTAVFGANIYAAIDEDIYGGGGSDALYGGMGYDLLVGDDGADTLNGDNGRDTLQGGAGNDQAFGGNGDDQIAGGAGDDYLNGAQGTDTIFGGAGNDTLADWQVPFDDGANISSLFGGAGDDAILFDGGSTVAGGAGNDSLSAQIDATEDALTQFTDFDAAQDDLLINLHVQSGASGELGFAPAAGGAGTILTYAGRDLVQFDGAAAVSRADMQVQFVVEGGENTTFAATTQADYVRIAASSGSVLTLGGDDTISLRDAGAVAVDAGAGNDVIEAHGGTLYGPMGDNDAGGIIPAAFDAHADTVLGGDGNDLLILRNGGTALGGSGNDIFAVDHALGSAAYGLVLPAAEINDFNPAQDKIELDTSMISGAAPASVSIAVWANGLGADILIGSAVIAKVAGGQGLTVNDLTYAERNPV